MGIFEKFKVNTATDRLLEEQWYEAVVKELENGVKKGGIWAKALERSKGDETKAKAFYITYRIQSMKDAVVVNMELEEESKRITAKAKIEKEVAEAKRGEKRKIEKNISSAVKAKKCIKIIRSKGYIIHYLGNLEYVDSPTLDTSFWRFDIYKNPEEGFFKVCVKKNLDLKELCEFSDTAQKVVNKKQSLDFSSYMPFIIGGVIGFIVVFLIIKLL